ncbi:GDYXXLXY domain-containing protein [Sphingobacterium suaedae]|uniref:GDYXXLXY domain-containing protein n=1 Tax=Sphingobacterium suaedae TaxID=1686402 RepID=A0ABW5KBZ6_9SPHI
MKKYIPSILVVNLILVLCYMTYAIVSKEKILRTGDLVLLELSPVDPRSLMQGDYMDLRYRIADSIDVERIPRRGYCIVRMDSTGIAHRIRFQERLTPLGPAEYAIAYSSPDTWRIIIGAESFFFEEGQANKYALAKYGALRVDTLGNSLLVGLYDAHRMPIR